VLAVGVLCITGESFYGVRPARLFERDCSLYPLAKRALLDSSGGALLGGGILQCGGALLKEES